jgi:hypothetical protein
MHREGRGMGSLHAKSVWTERASEADHWAGCPYREGGEVTAAVLVVSHYSSRRRARIPACSVLRFGENAWLAQTAAKERWGTRRGHLSRHVSTASAPLHI